MRSRTRESSKPGKPLYQDYEMHFMVTQGIRDRKTLKVNYPLPNKKGPAGVFAHFFAMEVTWK